MPPGGCGLPLAYVRTAEMAGSTDLVTAADRAALCSKGVNVVRRTGVVNERVEKARRTSVDFAAFMLGVVALCACFTGIIGVLLGVYA